MRTAVMMSALLLLLGLGLGGLVEAGLVAAPMGYLALLSVLAAAALLALTFLTSLLPGTGIRLKECSH
jgi:hypothetical protein